MTDRILTTHVGALQRTPEAEAALLGEAPAEQLAEAVADVVRRQVEAGIDVVNDGEYGKSIWQWYVTERLGGIERQDFRGACAAARPRSPAVPGLLCVRAGDAGRPLPRPRQGVLGSHRDEAGLRRSDHLRPDRRPA
jgi:Methionine synthase II (cobalamin-independent)